jgi:RecJ OB domain
MGNAQPTLLVPAARFERVMAMGEEKEHSRFTLVTAGGKKSRGVAFRSRPSELAPAAEQPHDIALRLEKNVWNGTTEPRVLLRALCPTERGELRVPGGEGDFWEELRSELAQAGTGAHPPVAGAVEDHRSEGFAGVAGDLFSSGESVLVAVADVPRRRAGLACVVAGLADGPMAVVSWAALAADPRCAAGFDHLVALDPPPGGVADRLLGAAPRAHLAWGPVEADFAMNAYRAALDLRPQLTEVFLALRELPESASAEQLQAALCGAGRYPRDARTCARLVAVLTELSLVEFDLDAPASRVSDGVRSDLELSATFRSARAELSAIEQALAPELPRRLPAAATG